MNLSVHSIFDSIDGEYNGFRGAGQLSTFIRLQNCNLRCTYCDTAYARERPSTNDMEIKDVIDKVNCKKVTITGGEPLLQKEGVQVLVQELLDRLHLISIETNGSLLPFAINKTDLYKVKYIVDYKLSSSGEKESMLGEVFAKLRFSDVIKFVIGNRQDYVEALDIIKTNPDWKAQTVFSPVLIKDKEEDHFEMDLPRRLVKWMLEDHLDNNNNNIHFSLQIHKLIWWDRPITEEH